MTGRISLAENEITVKETDGFATVAFARAGNATGAVTIKYTLTENTALRGSDYVGGGGSVTIPAGERTATIRIPIKDDPFFEPTQDFSVAILSVSSGTLNAPRTTIVNILDDENPVGVDPEPPLESNYSVTEVPIFETRRAVDIEFVPGQENLMFVATLNGVVKVFDTEADAFLPDFIDLSEQVGRGSGMQSLEIHPDFPETPYVYVYYAVDPPETADKTGPAGQDSNGNRFMWLVRLEADPETNFRTAIPDSGRILVGGRGQSLDDISGGGALDFGEGRPFADLPSSEQIGLSDDEIEQGLEYKQNYIKRDGDHVGGGMAFGPDGKLYIAIGDGVAFNFADPRTFAVQDPDSLSGKVLRINPINGRGLADNPFREAGDSLDLNSSKVYQVGLRNPFALGFTNDGDLVISDTGQTSYEEINIGPAGANFGWPFYEGADFDRLFTPPNFRNTPANGFEDEWDAFLATDPEITLPFRGFAHKEAEPGFQFQAIVGGDVDYDGGVYPKSLNGHYFFSDFSDGEVFTIDLDDRDNVQFLYQHDGQGPVGFTQGPDGNVYYIDVIGDEVGYLEIEELDGGEPTDGVIGGVSEMRRLTHEARVVEYGDGVRLSDAVLFASPVSRNGEDPLTIEIDRIGERTASVRLQEADYLNGRHSEFETATLLALQEGVWEIGDGRQIEVGTVRIRSGETGFTTVNFDGDFDAAPLILTQLQSDRGDPEWAIVRTRDITATGFQMRIQEERANDGLHAASFVGYLAIEADGPGSEDVFEWDDLTVQAFSTGPVVTNRRAFDFADDLGSDVLVAASLASYRGATPANVRMTDLGTGRVQFAASPELSVDADPFLRAGDVHGLAFDGFGALSGVEIL